MEPVTFVGGLLISRVVGPIIQGGWKQLSNSEAREEKKRIQQKDLELRNAKNLKEIDLKNQIELKRIDYKQRLELAKKEHEAALKTWGTEFAIQNYYKACWPLRNPFQMMACMPIINAENEDDKSYFNDNIIVPCRLISALKDTDHPFARTINGNLSSFLINYFPANSIHSVVSEIGAWREDAPNNDASVNYLFEGLKKQPVMVLSPTLINDGKTFIFKVWSWGLGEDVNYPHGIEFGRLEIMPMYYQFIYEETMDMIRLGKEMEYSTNMFSKELLHNISIIKELKQKKISKETKKKMLSFLSDTPEIKDAVRKKMETNLSGIFCCIAGMYADTYHLLEYKTIPKLPSILSNITGMSFMLPVMEDFYEKLLKTYEKLEPEDTKFLAEMHSDIFESFALLQQTNGKTKQLTVGAQKDIRQEICDYAKKRFLYETDSYEDALQHIINSMDLSDIKFLSQIKTSEIISNNPRLHRKITMRIQSFKNEGI